MAVICVPLPPTLAERSVLEHLSVLFPACPQRRLMRLFAEGRVRSGGRPVAASAPIGAIADLEIRAEGAAAEGLCTTHDGAATSADPTLPELRLLHEDERLRVFSKPPGLCVVPERSGEGDSCLRRLVAHELAARVGRPVESFERPRIVHRTDRGTSGLLLVARTAEAERFLQVAFESRSVRKEYLAVLEGDVAAARTVIDCPIEAGNRGRMRLAPGGKEALTVLDVVERREGRSVVIARPRTGRTHQIRLHARAIGHPVAGDDRYGGGPFPRLALHAWRYTLPEAWPGPRSFVCEPEGELAAWFTAAVGD